MTIRKTFVGLTMLAATGAAAAYMVYGRSTPPQRPAFTLTDLAGQRHAVADYDGKVLVINFWASWCAPCRREVPMLAAAQHADGARGLQVLGVAIDRRQNVARFARAQHVNYPVFAAPTKGARIQDAYTAAQGPAGVLPYTAIVNRKGRIVQQVAGALTRQRLQAMIGPLLSAQAGKQPGPSEASRSN